MTFTALSDSGNLVKDPISNKSVIIVDRKIFSKIADISIFDNFAAGQEAEASKYRSLRLIPIKTAGGSSILVAILPDKMTVSAFDSKKKQNISLELDALVAPSELGKIADGCNAIIPAELIKF